MLTTYINNDKGVRRYSKMLDYFCENNDYSYLKIILYKW